MLQRLQTLYLFIIAVFSGGLILLLPFWKNLNGKSYYFIDLLNEGDWNFFTIPVLFILSAILSIVAIFLFKKRKQQLMINRFNLIVNIFLLGIIVYDLLSLSGESQISEKGIGLFIPSIVIVLLVLANKAIQNDEELVKSVDRLR